MNTVTSGANHISVRHGPPCSPEQKCHGQPGDELILIRNMSRGSADTEWATARNRVDNPADHAGSCARWGPDLGCGDEVSYP
jgi:hypothetical protein